MCLSESEFARIFYCISMAMCNSIHKKVKGKFREEGKNIGDCADDELK